MKAVKLEVKTGGYCIRSAENNDLSTLCEIFNRARTNHASFPDKALSLDSFSFEIKGEKLLVAERDGFIAGFLSIWAVEGFIHHLYIAPDHQRRGLGRLLLQACESRFGRPLSLKCLQSNSQACRFYETNGWHGGEVVMGSNGPYIPYVLL